MGGGRTRVSVKGRRRAERQRHAKIPLREVGRGVAAAKGRISKAGITVSQSGMHSTLRTCPDRLT